MSWALLGYVGRVGGLAIALGVGTAILTGQGVAYADETDASKPSTTSTENTTNTSTGKRPLGKHRVSEKRDERAGRDSDNSDDAPAGEVDAGEEKPDEDSTTVRSGDRRKHRDDAENEAASQGSQTAADPVDATAVEDKPEADKPAVWRRGSAHGWTARASPRPVRSRRCRRRLRRPRPHP